MNEQDDKSGRVPIATEELRNPNDVLSRIKQNTFWLFQSSAVARLLGLAQNILLARLLLPRDFGIFGLAGSIIGFTLIFGDVGIGTSLLYPKTVTEDHKSTAFWLNLSIASASLAVVIIVAPLVSRIYHQPALIRVLIALACAFWFQVVGVVHHNLLKRDLQFRALAIVEVVVGCLSLAFAATLAWSGWGVWAFVAPLLTANLINSALLWRVSHWTPVWRISKRDALEVGAFSRWYMAAAITFSFAFSLDRLLIGKYLGIESVGRYSFAFDLALASVAVIAAPLMQVVTPEFATLRFEPTYFWDAYVRVSGDTATVMAPICCAAILAAPALVPVVFGSKWVSSVLPFQILIVYMLIRTVIGDACGGWGRYDLAFRVGLGASIAGSLAIFVGLQYGIVGVALAVCIIGSATPLAGVYFTGSISAVARVVREAGPPTLVAAGAATMVYLIGRLIPPFPDWGPNVRALAETGLYLVTYAFFQRRRLSGLLGMLLRRPSAIVIAEESYPEC